MVRRSVLLCVLVLTSCITFLSCGSVDNDLQVTVTVSGLEGSVSLTLFEGTAQAGRLDFTENGSQIFTGKLALNTDYQVSVGTQPDGQTCAVADAIGRTTNANISVSVYCSATTHTISGVVRGTANPDDAGLLLNAGEYISPTDGSFTFTKAVPSNFPLNVTVYKNPATTSCSVTNGTGTVTSDVDNIVVNCTTAHAMFSTGDDTQHNGNLGGREGADAKCSARADAMELTCPGNIHAFISIDADDEIRDFVTNYNVRETLPITAHNIDYQDWHISYADNIADLLDGLSSDAPYFGVYYSGSTDAGALTDKHCENFTSSSLDIRGSIGEENDLNISSWYCWFPQELLCACLNERYQVGGIVAGLNGTLSLSLTEGDTTEQLSLTLDGPFAFDTLASDSTATYTVAIATQPTGQSCVIEGSTTTVATALSSLIVTCANNDNSAVATTGDMDGDSLTDAAEAQRRFVPLVNPFGSYQVSPNNILALQASASSPRVPSGIVTVSTGLHANSDDATNDLDSDSSTNSAEIAADTNLFIATSTGSFGSRSTLSGPTLPYEVAVGDFDGDGDHDIAATGGSDDTVKVFLGDGAGSFATGVTYAVGSAPYGIAVADLNGDDVLDLVTTNYSDDTVSILLGVGNGTFGTASSVAIGDAPTSVAPGDFDKDGDIDLVVANQGQISDGTTVAVLVNDGNASFASAAAYTVNTGPYNVTVGDWNLDTVLDLAVTHRGSNGEGNSVAILFGDGDATFTRQADLTTGDEPIGITTGDFDGDGDYDLATANARSASLSVFLNAGDGTFASKVDYSSDAGPSDVMAIDIDGDNDLDLVAAHWSNSSGSTLATLAGSGDGTFGAKSSLTTGSGPYALSVGDFDKDGVLDLVNTNFSDSSISVFLGE